MSDIAAFLTARLGEDQARARRANPSSYHYSASRALREVEAKRKILTLHRRDIWNADDDPEAVHCTECTTDDDLYKPQMWPCATVSALAAVYCDHPDFDPAWNGG